MAENRSRYAVLGALTVEPMSGYDLRRFFEQSVGFFWRESYGQIYPMLKQLQGEGLVIPEGGETRPGRTVYGITDAGRETLARWLGEPAEPESARVEILLKLFFAREGAPDAAPRLLAAFRAQQESRLAVYGAIVERITAAYAGNANLPNWLVTVRYGMHVTRALLAWCDEAERTLAGGRSPERDLDG